MSAAGKARLIHLYQEMSENTSSVCVGECKRRGACCDSMYCEIAIEWAKTQYGVMLARTQHPTLPLMGERGCVAEPYLRPTCTVHQCRINGLGFYPHDVPLTKRYFRLRRAIARKENFVALENVQGFEPAFCEDAI